MRREGGMKYSMVLRFDELKNFGMSKHDYKEANKWKRYTDENYNPSEVDGIVSYGTHNSYWQTAMEFTSYMQEEGINRYSKVTKDMAIEYLKEREDRGLSADTVRKDMSALNKIFDFDITQKGADLQRRSIYNIKRSRLNRDMDNKYDKDKYADQIEIAKSVGIRRQSMCRLKENDIYTLDDKMYVSVKEKNGKYRNAPVLDEKVNMVREILDRHNIQIIDRVSHRTAEQHAIDHVEGYNAIFAQYSNKIDNHSFRREYAQNFYNQEYTNKYANSPKHDNNKYDNEIVSKVSKALGHNRLEVTVRHYLKK